VVDQTHIVLEPLENLRACRHIGPRQIFFLDNRTVEGNLSNPLKSGNGLFLITLVKEPVGADDRRISNIRALDGQIAPSRGGEQGRANGEIVVIGAQVGRV
jgi:hypothetical protein